MRAQGGSWACSWWDIPSRAAPQNQLTHTHTHIHTSGQPQKDVTPFNPSTHGKVGLKHHQLGCRPRDPPTRCKTNEKKLTQTQTWRKLKSKKGGEMERRRRGEGEGQEEGGGEGRGRRAAAPPEGPSHHTEAWG